MKIKLRPVVFVHIQKTAGSSIGAIAQQYYSGSIITHGDYQAGRPEDFMDIDFVSGHFGYEFARHFMPARYSFTFLRDPFERVLSLYHFCKKMDPDLEEMYRLANELDLDGFLEYALGDNLLKTAVCNNQAWQLAHGYGHGTARNYFHFDEAEMEELALSHLARFSHVGFLETFEADRNIILNELNIPIPAENVVTNASGKRLPIKELPDSSIDLLKRLTRADRAVYKYALSCRQNGHN